MEIVNHSSSCMTFVEIGLMEIVNHADSTMEIVNHLISFLQPMER